MHLEQVGYQRVQCLLLYLHAPFGSLVRITVKMHSTDVSIVLMEGDVVCLQTHITARYQNMALGS